MVYLPDLQLHSSGYPGSDPWNDLPVKSIGWMEPPHPLPTGDVPTGFLERLAAFCTRDRLLHLTCGVHDCEFCRAAYRQSNEKRRAPTGNGEIRVLGEGVVYAAPTLIAHYVAVHRYLPPAEFIDAVMTGPAAHERVYVQYRLHSWEDLANQAIFEGELAQCQIERRPMRVKRFPPPGTTFGPLIQQYRRCHYTALVMAFALMLPLVTFEWRLLLVTVPALVLLAVLLRRFRAAIRCPVCRKQMDIPRHPPKRWSAPSGLRWVCYSTMYCHDCGIGLRSDRDLWGEFKSEIVTNW